MAAGVRYRIRRQLARNWWALVVVALVSGAVFGGAIAAAAAARRTASAYERFSERANAWDAAYVNYAEDGTAVLSADTLRDLPGVVAVHEVTYEYAALGSGVAYLADPTGELGTTLAAARVLEGRWLDDGNAAEMVVSFPFAEEQGLHVGDEVVPLPLEYLAAAESPEERAFVDAYLAAIPDGKMRVVGIVAAPGAFPPILDPSTPQIYLSPAFAALPEPSANTAELIYLRSPDDFAALADRVDELAAAAGGFPNLVPYAASADRIQRTLRPQVVALAALALVLAIAAVVMGVQAAARRVAADDADRDALVSVGMSRRQLVSVAFGQSLALGAATAVVAVAVAVGLSPLSPSGLAGIAEPDPGVALDAPALFLGALATTAAIALSGSTLSWLASRRRPRASRRRPFATALPLVADLGVRHALDRGVPPRAIPVRSTIAGTTLALAAVVMAATIATSLDRQLDDPARYGVRWDVELEQFTENSLAAAAPELLLDDERVAAAAVGVAGPTPINGELLSLYAMDPVRGEARPPVLRGAYPDSSDAVALGGRTLDAFGVDIGDSVELDFTEVGGTTVEYRVVGEMLLPPQGERGRMDEGVFLSVAGVTRAFDSDDPVMASIFLAAAGGHRVEDIVDDLVREVEPSEFPSVSRPTTPSDLIDLGRARSMPATIGGAMALAGVAALAHTLFVSVRYRRTQLAVLRALGVDGRQLFVATVVQSLTLGLVIAVIGVPTGVIVGRAVWLLLASNLGSPMAPSVPLIAVAVVIPAAVLALASALALVPGRQAARLHPGTALRSE